MWRSLVLYMKAFSKCVPSSRRVLLSWIGALRLVQVWIESHPALIILAQTLYKI